MAQEHCDDGNAAVESHQATDKGHVEASLDRSLTTDPARRALIRPTVAYTDHMDSKRLQGDAERRRHSRHDDRVVVSRISAVVANVESVPAGVGRLWKQWHVGVVSGC